MSTDDKKRCATCPRRKPAGTAERTTEFQGWKGRLERWIVLRGPAEAINLEKITFDRSTLNSIVPEEKTRRKRKRMSLGEEKSDKKGIDKERRGKERFIANLDERGGTLEDEENEEDEVQTRRREKCEWIVPVGRSW